MTANPSVTAGFRWASGLPQARAVKTPATTANAQPAVIASQPAFSPFDPFSRTPATTPLPSRIRIAVPRNSPSIEWGLDRRVYGVSGPNREPAAPLSRPAVPYRRLVLRDGSQLKRTTRRLQRQQALEERSIAAERDAEILGRNLVAFAPLTFERSALVGEYLR